MYRLQVHHLLFLDFCQQYGRHLLHILFLVHMLILIRGVTVSHPLAVHINPSDDDVEPTLVLFVAQGATCYGMMGMM